MCAWPDMWLSFLSPPMVLFVCPVVFVCPIEDLSSDTPCYLFSLDFLGTDSSVSIFLWDLKLLHAYRLPIPLLLRQALPILRISASCRRHIWSSLPALRKLHLGAFLPPMPPVSQSSCLIALGTAVSLIACP